MYYCKGILHFYSYSRNLNALMINFKPIKMFYFFHRWWTLKCDPHFINTSSHQGFLIIKICVWFQENKSQVVIYHPNTWFPTHTCWPSFGKTHCAISQYLLPPWWLDLCVILCELLDLLVCVFRMDYIVIQPLTTLGCQQRLVVS